MSREKGALRRSAAAARMAVLTAASLVICAAAPAPTVNVEIERFAFSPARLTIKAGAVIVFTNHDQVPHSLIGVMGAEEVFRSPEQIDEDESFRVILLRPGEVTYRCGLHSHMTGVISVIP
ncbi:cupredoxin domain-containing protein [Methylosinus sp. H3A]|uniref:cupredoxin domain-containing protein n=1 Tax=Methylosinus sp. H3A TaxID=2785786 RepID=UPI0018C3219E|nr:cupredoxin domain-containing protein [Methylosinus sp. H3A]MBG0810562.1 cupredoxin domain-containing protein [Methylosinus sp. H3A]